MPSVMLLSGTEIDPLGLLCCVPDMVHHVQAKAMSGKGQFPFLVDPNTGKQMLESDAIISYLWNEYGDGQVRSSSDKSN